MELSLQRSACEDADGAWAPAVAAAVAATIVATALRFAFMPYFGPAMYFRLYLVAVAASAWLAGLRGGFVATALAALSGTFFFLPPAGSWLPIDADSVTRLALFGAEALVISALVGAMRVQWRRAEANGTFARGQVLALERALEERRRAEREQAALLAQLGASERAYRLLAETVPQLVWAFGPDGRVSYCNERARAYLGLGPEASWPAGQLPGLHPDDAEPYRERVAAGFASAAPFEVAVRLRRACDGACRWHLVRFAALRTGRGRPEGWVGAATDVHDQKQAEEVIRAKDAFLSAVAHELRTPLGVVLNWAHLLQRGEVPEGDEGRAFEAIVRNARAQATLIDDALDVVGIAAGNLEPRPASIEPARVVETALESVRPAAEAKQIRLEAALEAPDATTRADAERLQHVAWHLLSNAIKVTPRGGKVAVGLRRVGAGLEVAVADTGRGIDPSFLPFVVERFRRADGGSARAHGGLGLGLAIVKHIVESHGGAVSVESEGDGRGATFLVRLPGGPDELRPAAG